MKDKEMKKEMTDKEFIEQVYEIAFGDDAINQDFTKEQVLAELSEFSAKALELDEMLDGCEYGHPGCMGGHDLEDSFETHWEKNGWTCLAVGGDEETGEPPFAYTVGLSVSHETKGEQEFPEIMVIGLNPDKAHMIIGELISYWKNNGIQYGRIGGVIKNFDVLVSPIDLDNTEGLDRFIPIHSFVFRDKHSSDASEMKFVQLIFPNPDGDFIDSEDQPILPSKPHLSVIEVKKDLKDFIDRMYDACQTNIDKFICETDGVSDEFKELVSMAENFLANADLNEEQRGKVEQLHNIFSANVLVDWMENDPADEFSSICDIIKSFDI